MKIHARRLAVCLAVVGLGVVLIGPPAWAAMPAFEWEVEARTDSIGITVTFEPVSVGFAWRNLEGSGSLGELVGVLPASAVDQQGRPTDTSDLVLADLQRVEIGIYAADVAVGQGEWAVVAWPMVPDYEPDRHPETPLTDFVTVGPETDRFSTAWLPVLAGVVLFGIGGAIWFSRRRQRVDA